MHTNCYSSQILAQTCNILACNIRELLNVCGEHFKFEKYFQNGSFSLAC